MFNRLRNTIVRFIAGRYGTDHLNRFLMGTYLALWVLSSCFARTRLGWPLSLLATATAVVLLWRTLSRNIPARQAENEKFLRRWTPTKDWLRRQWTRLRDVRRCRYRRCPGCGTWLRLPIKRGRRTVTCNRCRAQFRTFFL